MIGWFRAITFSAFGAFLGYTFAHPILSPVALFLPIQVGSTFCYIIFIILGMMIAGVYAFSLTLKDRVLADIAVMIEAIEANTRRD